MKCAFIDLDGTLVKLPVNHEECKQVLGVNFYKDVPKGKYYIIDVYEKAGVDKAEMVLDSDRLINRLQEYGYYIVLVTRTGRKAVDMCLRKFQWLCPDLILSRDDVEYLKPDKRHIISFISSDKIDNSSVVIGDSWHDAELAKALGLTYYDSVSAAMKGLEVSK